jgi:hypothetical protein
VSVDPNTGLHRRGTTNRNARGSSEDRRRRREYLVEHYRADVDVIHISEAIARGLADESTETDMGYLTVSPGFGQPACRCYRCGRLLTVDTVSPDRRIPGCEGGTYARDNIRPACEPCQSHTGGVLSGQRRAARRAEVTA